MPGTTPSTLAAKILNYDFLAWFFLSKNIIDGVVVSCKKIVEEQLPETWILDTLCFMEKWVEGKLTKTVLHFLAYLMIFRNLDICSTTTFFCTIQQYN